MLLSVNKILMLLAILAAVWYGFKLVGRLDRARKDKLRAQGQDRAKSPPRETKRTQESGDTIDLVRSPDGKSFVPRGSDREA